MGYGMDRHHEGHRGGEEGLGWRRKDRRIDGSCGDMKDAMQHG
jgi:hypothetical protein